MKLSSLIVFLAVFGFVIGFSWPSFSAPKLSEMTGRNGETCAVSSNEYDHDDISNDEESAAKEVSSEPAKEQEVK